MPATNAEYYQARAEQELERAQQATDSRVVAVHFALAELYLERVVAEAQASAASAA
ncbi:hypothetical protein HJG53_12835 [Sphingomonas sp. ID1715]|uniref:hypothetical protein n=1 Tax=Sphingomonas sp. ID1715 TaxID=1656898 RepID=UPI0014898628|nr:hypothetical protein [Sphingomonas sp. ID1715]NNM77794.1 hypothetical protein [Sphingomonas sp. ID1715]